MKKMRAETDEEKMRRILAKTNEIMAKHPDIDRDNVKHTLILLEMPPIERLQRSLQRGQLLNTK